MRGRVGGVTRSGFIPRRAALALTSALADTRVVLVNGARQVGKSTLVRAVAGERKAEWRDLDRVRHRDAAQNDPEGFVLADGLMVIDEIQRVPELLLAIKVAVDSDPRPGRFLLTGSSRLLALRELPDTLPGRMETVELWPFSQGEIDGTPDGFVNAIFQQGLQLSHSSEVTRAEYTERIVRGGMPEAVAREDVRRRGQFFDSYVGNLVEREVKQLAEIERVSEMTKLVGLLAARSGQILTAGGLESALNLTRPTIARYLGLLEGVFLIKRIPGWSRNLGTRAVGASKLVFVDSGLASHLVDQDAHMLRRPEGQFGPLLEGFVISELARQLSWSDERVNLYHYRDDLKVEVDVVLEHRRGPVVGIEVKAANTVRSDDFRGLRRLAERLGDDFVAGVVLYTGTDTLPFGPKMRAMPVSALWEVGP